MKEVCAVKVMKVKKERLTQIFIYILAVQGAVLKLKALLAITVPKGAREVSTTLQLSANLTLTYDMGICGDHLFRIYLKE